MEMAILKPSLQTTASKRWVTVEVNSITGEVDFDDNGEGGGTRVVGIYEDPLIAEGSNNEVFYQME